MERMNKFGNVDSVKEVVPQANEVKKETSFSKDTVSVVREEVKEGKKTNALPEQRRGNVTSPLSGSQKIQPVTAPEALDVRPETDKALPKIEEIEMPYPEDVSVAEFICYRHCMGDSFEQISLEHSISLEAVEGVVTEAKEAGLYESLARFKRG